MYFKLLCHISTIVKKHLTILCNWHYYIISFVFSLLEHDRPSRKDLNIHVVPSVAIKWKVLGEVILHHDIVETGYLEIIEKDNPKDVVECCKKMFIKWLEADKDASWEKLITALQSSSIQLNSLAEEIIKKLQKGETIVATNKVVT